MCQHLENITHEREYVKEVFGFVVNCAQIQETIMDVAEHEVRTDVKSY